MFYDTFKRLCETKGISVSRAATEIGLSNSTPTKWKKTGATPDSNTLSKIASYFNITVGYLLGNEKAPTEDGERKISDDEIKFALWGTKEINDDVLDRVKQFAKFAQEEEKSKNS